MIFCVVLLSRVCTSYTINQRRLWNQSIIRMDFFAKIVNGWKLLTIFAKSSVLDVWLGSEHASVNLNLIFFFVILVDNGNNVLGPSDLELLKLLDQCDLSSSRCTTPLRGNSNTSLQHVNLRNQFLRHQISSSSLGTNHDFRQNSRNELESSYNSNASESLTVSRRVDELGELTPSFSLRASGRFQRNRNNLSESSQT